MSSIDALLPQLEIKINGSQAAADLADALADCTVENSLHLPDACTLRIYDNDFRWLDESLFSVGAELEILASENIMPQEAQSPQLITIFAGEITGFEVEMEQEATILVVRALNRAHRLHRGRQRRSFLQMTDSDIAQKVAQEVGCTPDVDATTTVHRYVFQNNQTNWEFLSERAAHNGFRLYVKDKKLSFKRVTATVTDVVTLEWGEALRSFRPSLTAGSQVDKVTVRSWDPLTKQPLVGQAQTPNDEPQVGFSTNGGQTAKKGFSQAAEMVVVDRPMHSQQEAQDMARSVYDDISGEFIEAEGLCDGNPNLLPGKMVSIQNIGTRFSGKYFVTSTIHTYSPSGYDTRFIVSGKRAETLLALFEHNGNGRRAPLGGNIVVGLVTNNKDPNGYGRVKVKFPWLSDDEESDWARIAAPMAGPGRGIYFLPEINDEVLVAFEHGDVRRPFILGALWNGVDKPIEPNTGTQPNQVVGSDGKVNHRIIQTRIGHTILLDDTNNKGEIKLTTAGKHILTLDDAHQKIEAHTTTGHKITLDDLGQRIVIVDKTGNNKMTITSPSNAIAIECMGNFSVNAKGKVSIQGLAGVDVKSPAMVDINGTASTSVKSAGIVQVQGLLVKIN